LAESLPVTPDQIRVIGCGMIAREILAVCGQLGLDHIDLKCLPAMRRTKVAEIYKKTGNLRAVQLLLGHTKMDSTVRYLGVDVEDALAISEGVEI